MVAKISETEAAPFTLVDAARMPERKGPGRTHVPNAEDNLATALLANAGKVACLAVAPDQVTATSERIRRAAARVDRSAEIVAQDGHLYVRLVTRVRRPRKDKAA